MATPSAGRSFCAGRRHLTLGHAHAERDLERAFHHLERARAWVDRSGEAEATLRAHELHVRLARLAADEPTAAAQRRALLGLAQSTGAAYFERRGG